MKFLVIGSKGSMGKRRVRDLKQLGHDVTQWDIIDNTKLPMDNYDAVVVSTPPDKHEEYMNFKVPTFVEASILPYTPKNSEFIYPSATMRFHPTVKALKENNHKPLAFTYHVGNYLPDWHPAEDYTKKYFSQKLTGGAREIVPYETNWMTWVLGPAECMSSEYFKLSEMPIKANDYYRFSLGFDADVVGTVVIDTLCRPQKRDLRLIYEGNVVDYDMQSVGWEGIYLEEMESFVSAVRGGKYPYSVQEDLWNLKLLSAIEFGLVQAE